MKHVPSVMMDSFALMSCRIVLYALDQKIEIDETTSQPCCVPLPHLWDRRIKQAWKHDSKQPYRYYVSSSFSLMTLRSPSVRHWYGRNYWILPACRNVKRWLELISDCCFASCDNNNIRLIISEELGDQIPQRVSHTRVIIILLCHDYYWKMQI